MTKGKKLAFYIVHVILLLIAIQGVLTWKTELPDGTIFIDPMGFVLLPIVILSLLRLSIGRILLFLYSCLQVATGFSALFSGHAIAGGISIVIFGFTLWQCLSGWKPAYTILGVFKRATREPETEIAEPEN